MIYHLNELEENKINPLTGCEYDNSWLIFRLTDSKSYQLMCGRNNGCAYTIKVSRSQYKDWDLAIGDFIEFNETNGKNIILVMTEEELKLAKNHYIGHTYNDPFLRDNEPSVLVHCTPMNNWNLIECDGMLKSWNKLKAENSVYEDQPIGVMLGDPIDFSDYIMFGGGITGEIVVNSKQQGKIVMDENEEYLTGARLYFDAKRIAQDGLLVRDGCHLKVKNILPLKPYLIWAATWDSIGLSSQVSTPKIFAEQADKQFQIIAHTNGFIDEKKG